MFNFYERYFNDDFFNMKKFNDYFARLLIKKSNLYRKNGLDDIKTCDILRSKSLFGMIGVYFDETLNKYTYGCAVYDAPINSDGRSDKIIITRDDGVTFHGTVNVDCVVLWNNSLYMSDVDFIGYYSKMLTDVDTSMNVNVIKSRPCDIPVVANDKIKRQIEEVDKKVKDGKTVAIVNEEMNNPFDTTTNNEQLPMYELTHPEVATYLQNLSRYHEELIKRACLELGIYVNNKDKGAQLTEEELNGFKAYTVISADDEFECLKMFCEDMKSTFNIDVEFIPKSFIETEKELEQEENNESEVIENDNIKTADEPSERE